jgi:heme/copper-type cytochrome/quinol oxidase subunit 2
MSRSQRLTLLGIAALIAVVAVILLVSSGGDDEETTATGAQATPTATETAAPEPDETATATPTATPTATAEPEPPLVIAGSGEITKLRFNEGDTVEFRVRSDVADEIHVHGYDLMQDIEPGETIKFKFPADITGIFEVELEGAGEQIAQLRVDP